MAEYDPAKAHAYYLRTRELKGRQVSDKNGATATTASRARSAASSRPAYKAQPRVQSHRDAKTISEIRVAALKVRLEKLKGVLKQLIAEAKARSGVKSVNKDGSEREERSDKGTGTGQKSEPKTASEKKKAAEAAKELYDKTHPEQALERDIAEMKKKIWKARKRLEDVIEKARKNTQP